MNKKGQLIPTDPQEKRTMYTMLIVIAIIIAIVIFMAFNWDKISII